MFGVTPVSVRTVLVALACALAASFAQAAPDSNDPIAKLLADKGVIEVRDATSDLVISAMNFLGVPYKRGGNSDAGFDCSGFTRHIYENSLGLLLPRKVDDQAKATGLAPVKRTELKPGDLVFFNTLKRTFSHVGIYVGDDKFIHAPRPGGEIRVESMDVRYWAKRFTGARRPAQAALPAVTPAATVAPSAPEAPAPVPSGFPNDIPP
ncbi:MAG TPA: C40 family peptidase [Rhizobacter sp.]|nr:C40 family peptidase [Rhizobacter sp.]